MNVQYREGRKEDSFRLAELDNIASDGAIDFLFHDLVPDMTPVQAVVIGSNHFFIVFPPTLSVRP